MLFKRNSVQSRIDELEKELAEFHSIQADLKEEMLYFCIDSSGNIKESNSHFLHSLPRSKLSHRQRAGIPSHLA